MSDPPPDSRLRQDLTDSKDYLDLDGSVLKVHSFWNLSRVEKGMSLYRSGIKKDGTIRFVKVPITNPEVVATFYKPLKSLLVDNCTSHGFRGGAFAEKVQKNSPLNDILQFIYWSPVMTKEHRYFFKMEILDLYQQVVSRLKEPSVREFIDARFMAPYIERLEKISAYFEMEAANPVPLPTDISDAWFGEFGPEFTANYKKALAGESDASFKVHVPIRNQHGMTMKGFNDVDIKDLYPLRFAAERFAGANLTSFPPMGDPEYGKALNQIADANKANQARKRENFGFGAGLSMAPPVRPPTSAPEYRDYFPHPADSEDSLDIELEERDDGMSISSVSIGSLECHDSKKIKAKGKGKMSML